MALCYFELDDLENARKHIDIAQARDRDNRYVVDLQVQIAMRQGDREAAYKQLAVLEMVDDRAFFDHRRSTVEYVFGNFQEAYSAAHAAFERLQRPPFAIMSQLIKSEITVGRLREAGEHIQSLVENYPATYHDIKIDLQCKWEAAQGNFENALGLWEKLRNKDRLVHKALRRQALVGLLAQIDVADPRRDAYEGEVEALTAELAPRGIPALEANWGNVD